jgi:hypothetical protein
MKDGDILPPEIMARREDWQEGVSIYMRQRTVGEGTRMVAPVTWVECGEGYMRPPLITLRIQQAQQLMDELWQCGLRPTEGTGSAGSLAATQAHLKDMRAIAMNLLDMGPQEIPASG